jgi:hypothetical protein
VLWLGDEGHRSVVPLDDSLHDLESDLVGNIICQKETNLAIT